MACVEERPMKQCSRSRGLWKAGLAAWAVLAASASAQAGRALSFRVAGPFSMRSMQGAWAQRTARVENVSAEQKLVQVEYVTRVAGQGEISFARVFSVPPMAVRRAEMVIRPEDMKRAKQRLAAKAGGDANRPKMIACEQKYVLWDLGTGERTVQDFGLDLKFERAATRLTVIETANYKHDATAFLRKMPDLPIGRVARVGTVGLDLPTRWYGYSMLDIVFLGGVEMSRMGAARLEALLEWVRRGGTLVMTGSVDMREMLQEQLADAAGVTAMDVHYVSRLKVAGFVKPSTGAPMPDVSVRLQWPQPMVALLPLEAKVVLTGNGLPLLTEKRYGRGQVFALATSLGAVQDRALHKIWKAVAVARRLRPAVDPRRFTAPAREALEKIAGRRAPRQIVPVTLLVAAAGLTALLGILLRLRRRGEILWILLVPAGLVVAAVLYGAGLARGDSERLSHIGMICGLGDGLADQQVMFAYYSGPKQQTITVSSGGPRGLIADVGEAGAGAISVRRVRFDNAVLLPDQVVNTNAMRVFQAASVAETDGIISRLSFDESGLAGTLNNQLGFDIAGAVICVNRRTYRLGDISADGNTAVKVTRDDYLGRLEFFEERREAPRQRGRPVGTAGRPSRRRWATGEFSARLAPGPVDALRNQLVSRMLSIPGFNTRVGRGPVLIGYTERCPIDPLPGRKLQRQGWSVVTWPLRYVSPRPGTRMRIPSGFVNVEFSRVPGIAPLWSRQAEAFHFLMRDAGVMVSARPPGAVGRLARASAELEVDLRTPGFRLSVLGLGAGERAGEGGTLLQSFDNPAGRKIVPVADANRFRAEDGSYRFLIRIEKLVRGQGAGRAGPSARGEIQSVDVGLEGITE